MNRKQKASVLLDAGIALCAALCLYFLYNVMESGAPRRIITGALLLPPALILIYECLCWSGSAKSRKIRDPEISTLALLGEDDRPLRIWDLTGKVGLLIGKSSEEYQVDIDLSDTDYHTYIDPEHALLNFQGSGWWLQDTSDRNGLSIIRKGKELLPGRNVPSKLEPGDVIRIAHYTRIAVN